MWSLGCTFCGCIQKFSYSCKDFYTCGFCNIPVCICGNFYSKYHQEFVCSWNRGSGEQKKRDFLLLSHCIESLWYSTSYFLKILPLKYTNLDKGKDIRRHFRYVFSKLISDIIPEDDSASNVKGCTNRIIRNIACLGVSDAVILLQPY